MSDHDAAPDPIDRAYAQAEAMLDDDAARAARRARVLGAVAGEPKAAPVVSAPPKPRVSWAAGGWLAAASVAGVSVLLAIQLSTPPVIQRPSPPAEPPAAAAAAPAPAPAQAQAPASPPAVEAAPPAPPAAPQARVNPSADVAAPAPSAFPAPPGQTAAAPVIAAAPAPPPAAPRAPADSVEALIVTGQPAAAPSAARAARAESPMAQAPAPSPAVRVARLHAAAAAGRLAELETLLAQGVPVDAPDSAGETALMKSIQARSAAAAALLRRHGASLDRTNAAGVSARDMAASIDDADVDRALGLEP